MKTLRYRHIKELRIDKDLSQSDIANELNITQRAYSRYETGESDIPTEILCRLADYHNTSTDYLLDRIQDPAKPLK